MSHKNILLFSDVLGKESLKKVNYYSYFPVLEEKEKNDDTTIRILPSDDCIAYTLEFELSTKKILKGEKNWFNEPLLNKINPARVVPFGKIKSDFGKKNHKKCIFFNLLDFCYGHSLLKLLNLEVFWSKYADTHDFFIVDFPDITDYIPKGRFNSFFLNDTFSGINQIYNLEPLLAELRLHYEVVDFPILDAYLKVDNKAETIDFFNFYGPGENPYKSNKIVTLYYRKEAGRKLWSSNEAEQGALFLSCLKPYFHDDVLYCVIGDKDESIFPSWIMDKRTTKYPNPMVYEYSQILSSSVLVVGVIGSNLVLPSLISPGMVVHVVKEDFTRLTATDAINYNGFAINTAFEQVYLYENIEHGNYSPKALAHKIVRLFAGRLFINYRNKALDLLNDSIEIPSQTEYILKEHSYYNYEKIIALEKEINAGVYVKQRNQLLLQNLKKDPSKLIAKIVKRILRKSIKSNFDNSTI